MRWGRFYSVFCGVWILYYYISAFLRFWRNIPPISPTLGISYAEVYVSTRPIVRKIRKKNQIRRWEADNQYIPLWGWNIIICLYSNVFASYDFAQHLRWFNFCFSYATVPLNCYVQTIMATKTDSNLKYIKCTHEIILYTKIRDLLNIVYWYGIPTSFHKQIVSFTRWTTARVSKRSFF